MALSGNLRQQALALIQLNNINILEQLRFLFKTLMSSQLHKPTWHILLDGFFIIATYLDVHKQSREHYVERNAPFSLLTPAPFCRIDM